MKRFLFVLLLLGAVPVFAQFDPEIPSQITSNGDGVNDNFLIKATGVTYTYQIYDRWGKLIFEGENNVAWDATSKGSPVMNGVYIYIATFQYGNETIIKKGTVDVLR